MPPLLLALLLVSQPAGRGARCAIDHQALEVAIAQAEARIETYLDTIAGLTGGQTPGTSVAVSACGQIVWQQGFGWADIEQQIPVTPSSLFRAGSIAKPFTSALLGQAFAEHRLAPDTPISAYLSGRPNAPVYATEVTARQLAGHLAGVRHYDGDEFYDNTAYASVGEELSVFAADALVNDPGIRFFYSSYGWNLLSAVLEDAWPGNYLDLMQRQVFDPAGMTNTYPEGLGPTPPGTVTFYDFDLEQRRIQPAPAVNNSGKWASGGFLSTPSDILRFSLRMHDGTLVSGDVLTMLTQGQEQADGQPTGYGLGWDLDMAGSQLGFALDFYSADLLDPIGARLAVYRSYGHTGGSVGGRSVYIAFPDAPGGLAVAAMTNVDIGPVYAVPIAAAFLDIVISGD